MVAENAAAATSTTTVAPAAADPVSALQAVIFSAYGSLYQSVAIQAEAVHEQFVATLRSSAGSYSATEGVNHVSTSLNSGSTGNPIEWLSSALGGPSPSLNNQPLSLSSNAVNLIHTGMTNWVAATSDLLGMTGGGLIPEAAAAVAGDAAATGLVAGVSPVAAVSGTSIASGPASAGLGQAVSVGRLSAPPSWAVQAGPEPVAALSTGAPGSRGPGVAAIPAGIPVVASAGRSGGYGRPRYGVKPTVMGKPPAV